MGKTFETKKKILELLKKRNMTVTDISQELKLSHATVSQHISELAKAGAIEKIDNEHYKKVTYYKVSENQNGVLMKYVLGVVGILIVVGVAFYLSGVYTNTPVINTSGPIINTSGQTPHNTSSNLTSKNTNTTLKNATPISNETPILVSGSGATIACPMLFYELTGTVKNNSNYTVNGTQSTYKDFVLGKNTTTIFSIEENVSNVLNESDSSLYNRQHYVHMNQINNVFNSSEIIGIYGKFSNTNYTVKNNESINFNLTVQVGENATENTYMVHIDGPCGGGVKPFLITVGNKPYTGNVTVTAIPYA